MAKISNEMILETTYYVDSDVGYRNKCRRWGVEDRIDDGLQLFREYAKADGQLRVFQY